jgi:hypothetical protein
LFISGCSIISKNEQLYNEHEQYRHTELEEIQNYMRPIPSEPGPERDTALKEMLFRYVIENNEQIGFWFIDYGNGQDPPQSFLDHFSDLEVSVKKLSEGSYHIVKQGVYDINTGQRGAIVRAKINRWLNQDTVEVEYSHHIDPQAAGGDIVLMSYKNGIWTIIEYLKSWVS